MIDAIVIINNIIQSGSTAVMLAAEYGHKDVVLFLTQKGANLDLVNKVSVHAHMLYEKVNITDFLV